jgi:6-phosphofructo-2-kinase/fructose-2,6-biphosphatase 2
MKIFITRHGESINNTLNIIGGDCKITEKGLEYAKFLGSYLKNENNLTVWTSQLIRTKETAEEITNRYTEYKELNEIDSGIFDGVSIDYIKEYCPTIYKLREENKVINRYPEGENYLNVQKRVYKLLDTIDMEKDGILLIICHQAISRIVYSYFSGISIYDCVNIKIDLHTLYKIEDKKLIKHICFS